MCKCVNIRMLLLHSTPKTVPPFWVITDGTSLDQDIQDVRQIIASAVEQVRPIMDTRQHQLTLRDSSVAGYEVTSEHSAKDALNRVAPKSQKPACST